MGPACLISNAGMTRLSRYAHLQLSICKPKCHYRSGGHFENYRYTYMHPRRVFGAIFNSYRKMWSVNLFEPPFENFYLELRVLCSLFETALKPCIEVLKSVQKACIKWHPLREFCSTSCLWRLFWELSWFHFQMHSLPSLQDSYCSVINCEDRP